MQRLRGTPDQVAATAYGWAHNPDEKRECFEAVGEVCWDPDQAHGSQRMRLWQRYTRRPSLRDRVELRVLWILDVRKGAASGKNPRDREWQTRFWAANECRASRTCWYRRSRWREPSNSDTWMVQTTCPVSDKKVAPHYPESARVMRTQGTVDLYGIIAVDGRVTNLTTVRSAGSDLDRSSLDAVSQWTYRPAMCGTIPVPSETVISVHYSLSP